MPWVIQDIKENIMPDTQSTIDTIKNAGAYNPASFAVGRPPMEYDATRKYANNKNKQTQGNFRESTEYGVDKSRGYTQEQYDTDPTKLYKHQNKNIAKGEGPEGMFNNKSYDSTLRLAREADAYNAMPVDHMFVGTKGNVQDLGTGIDKPKLETMETRAINQTIDLDTNRKKLQQGLQDAVDHKDLEAFKDLYKQLYGFAVSEADAEREFTKFVRSQELMNYLKKDYTVWQRMFDLHIKTSMMQRLFNLSQTDPDLAAYIGGAFGMAVPTMDEHVGRNATLSYMQACVADHGSVTQDDWNSWQKIASAYSEKQNMELAHTMYGAGKNNWWINRDDAALGKQIRNS